MAETWRRLRWWLLAAAIGAAYGLAVAYEPGRPLGERFVDVLKLWPPFPGWDRDAPWEYIVARHLAALSALLILGGVVWALLADRAREFRAARRRGHAVVCGLGDVGLRSTYALRAAGQKVTCLEIQRESGGARDARSAGAIVLHRDATHAASLHDARVERCGLVVCACPDDTTNAKIASLVVRLAHGRLAAHGPSIHVHVDDPDLAQLLRAPLATIGVARLHFFNSSTVWARALLDHPAGPFASLDGDPPHIVVVGAAGVGSAVVVGAARRWHAHLRQMERHDRAKIVVLDPRATSATGRLLERYPAIGRTCDVVCVDDDIGVGTASRVARADGGGAVGALYVCLEDDSLALSVAVDADQQLDGRTPVLLPASGVGAELAPLLPAGGGIHAVTLAGPELELLHDEMRELIAREVHTAYLEHRAAQPDAGTRPAEHPWQELDEEARRANRGHADEVIQQLRAVWYDVEPLYDWDEQPVILDETAVEAMAELEHARWFRAKVQASYRPSATRIDAQKLHDLLVPWAALPPGEQELDRALVRRRPEALARAGFRLVRNPVREKLARLLHERYVELQAAAPQAKAWAELPDEYKDANRAAVDHIAVKLARIGCRALPGVVGPFEEATFTDEEVEVMAELEHERWLADKRAHGWTEGPRDEVAKTHPAAVPWERLPPSERKKDRDAVCAIPELLAAASYVVVRDAEHQGNGKFAHVL